MADENYTLKEALAKLALTEEQLNKLVRDGRIREFRVDGQANYNVAEIDALAAEINPALDGSTQDASSETSGGSAIELLPVDASDGGTDVISLDESGEQPSPVTPSKDDTVITPAGVSVFDEDELAGLEVDPMAKTQIAQSVTDELSLEGGDTGSGLLDLARESDDTSLGGVLDEIPPGDESTPTTGAPATISEHEGFEEVAEAAPAVAGLRAVTMEVLDPLGGLYAGMVVAAMILLGFSGLVVACLIAGVMPGFLQTVASFMPWTLLAAVVIAVIISAVGLILGKR